MGMFVYSLMLGSDVTTNATPATANDFAWHRPGTRNLSLQAIYLVGKAAALTSISGIAIRVEKWFTTASSVSALTLNPKDIGMQAAKGTAGMSATTVTSGTGGPTLLGSIGCGAAGPGGWVAQNPDAMPTLEGGDNKSIDLFNVSNTASLKFECSTDVVE